MSIWRATIWILRLVNVNCESLKDMKMKLAAQQKDKEDKEDRKEENANDNWEDEESTVVQPEDLEIVALWMHKKPHVIGSDKLPH